MIIGPENRRIFDNAIDVIRELYTAREKRIEDYDKKEEISKLLSALYMIKNYEMCSDRFVKFDNKKTKQLYNLFLLEFETLGNLIKMGFTEIDDEEMNEVESQYDKLYLAIEEINKYYDSRKSSFSKQTKYIAVGAVVCIALILGLANRFLGFAGWNYIDCIIKAINFIFYLAIPSGTISLILYCLITFLLNKDLRFKQFIFVPILIFTICSVTYLANFYNPVSRTHRMAIVETVCDRYYVPTEYGTKYHEFNCRYIKNMDINKVRGELLADLLENNYTACKVCKPYYPPSEYFDEYAVIDTTIDKMIDPFLLISNIFMYGIILLFIVILLIPDTRKKYKK